MNVHTSRQERSNVFTGDTIGRTAKRLLDVTVSVFVLAALAPLLLMIAIAIKLEDGGPLLFVQSRVGKDGRVFGCYKFRTMVVDAESRGAGLEIVADDDRITRAGRFLREWSLDEIPQVVNVLLGDMSLVGPRPTVPSQVEQYTPRQRRRLEVKPGMAGWAWIHGRNRIPWQQRIELDIWYVDNWSFFLDMRVFMIGVSKLLKRDGVYMEDGGVTGFQSSGADAGSSSVDVPASRSREVANKQRIVVVGGGGHGIVVADAVKARAERGHALELVGVVDDNQAIGTRVGETAVLGKIENLRSIEHDAVIVAIGDNLTRSRVFGQLVVDGETPISVIHPSAIVAPTAKLGQGVVICAQSVVGPDASIGDNVILNTSATVDHHCTIAAHAHVCPGVNLAGNVNVGEGAFIGTGASVVPHRSIGAWSIVGAGGSVVDDVPAGTKALGVPARWSIKPVTEPTDPSPTSVPMSSPDIGAAERAAIAEVMDSQWLSMGPFIEDFERRVAEYLGVECAVAVSSGTAGLHLALIGAGVERDDLVVTTPFSFIASANPILYQGGVPIFVDIDPESLNINPSLVEEAVSELSQGRGERWLPPSLADAKVPTRDRTKALLPVHVFGQPADLEPLLKTAKTYGLELIEDACEALGSQYKGQFAGALGDAAVFAFYANKQMTTGEGGMVVTNSQEKAALYRSLRNQGRDEFNAWLDHVRLGFNYRMDEMSAALGATQMKRLGEILSRRSQTAAWYGERLAEMGSLVAPVPTAQTTRMSWFVYVVRLAEEFDRDAVMRRLAEHDIPSRPYFPPIHLQPFYRSQFGYREGQFPVTERISQTTLALPFSGVMSEEQVDLVCDALRSVLTEGSVLRDRATVSV